MVNLKCAHSSCTGCTACESICPIGCIKLSDLDNGFNYPVVGEEKCIKCGLCLKVCEQIQQNKELKVYPSELYAAISKNSDIRRKSRSGGAFAEVSKAFLQNGGYVYGSAFSDDLRVIHTCTDNIEKYDMFAGSKYAQSDLEQSYKNVYKQLAEGNLVLFSGTPCQVAGLKRYLTEIKADQTNLFTIDLICHGVGSPIIYKKYCDFMEQELNCKIKSFKFRDKCNGWYDFMESFKTDDDKEYRYFTLSTLFCNNYSIKSSCFECKYASLERVGDITLGDFHGIERRTTDERFLDNKGVSCVLINSSKGKELFDSIEEQMDIFAFPFDAIGELSHPNLHHPTEKPRGYEKFWELEKKKDFSYLANRYGYYGKRGKIYSTTDRVMGAVVRKISKVWR